MWFAFRPLMAFTQALFWPFFAVFIRIFWRFKVVNRPYSDVVKLKEPCLAVSNHTGMLDPYIIGLAMRYRPTRYPFHYIAKVSLMRVPLIGQIIWLFGAFGVKRGIGLENSLTKALAILKRNGVLFIFPEGKIREKVGRVRKARRGVAYLASQVPEVNILPVHIERHRAKLTVAFGQPFKLADIYKGRPKTLDELAQAAEKIMQKSRALKNPT